MKKLLLILLSLMLSVTLALGLSSCADDGEGDGDGNGSSDGTGDGGSADSGDGEGGGSADSGDEGEEEIRAIYESYVIAVTASGETPLSYDEWLKTVKGDKGDTGAPGKDGTRWHVGTTAPTNVSGANIGDFYINTESFEVYYLTANGWSLLGSIKGEDGEDASGGAGTPGAPGEDGTVWFTGAGAPVSIAGAKAGDLYLDTASCDVYKYESGAWTKITNIKGDKGDDGEPGTGAGTPGEPGEDGTRWIVGDGVPTSHYNANVGDIYLNTVNCDFYKFTADGWVKAGSLKGDKGDDGNPGAAGTVWHYGVGAPASVSGAKRGDFYLDTYSCDLYALEVTGWVKIANIKGDKGDDGEPGSGGGNAGTSSELETTRANALAYVNDELEILGDDGFILTSVQNERVDTLVLLIENATTSEDIASYVGEFDTLVYEIRNPSPSGDLEALRAEKLSIISQIWNDTLVNHSATQEQIELYNQIYDSVSNATTEDEIHTIINDEFEQLIWDIQNSTSELEEYRQSVLDSLNVEWQSLCKSYSISPEAANSFDVIRSNIQNATSIDEISGYEGEFYALRDNIQNAAIDLENYRNSVLSNMDSIWNELLTGGYYISELHSSQYDKICRYIMSAESAERIDEIRQDFDDIVEEIRKGGSSDGELTVHRYIFSYTYENPASAYYSMNLGTDIDEFMYVNFVGAVIYAVYSDGSCAPVHSAEENELTVEGAHEALGDEFTVYCSFTHEGNSAKASISVIVKAPVSHQTMLGIYYAENSDYMGFAALGLHYFASAAVPYYVADIEDSHFLAELEGNILTVNMYGNRFVFELTEPKDENPNGTIAYYVPDTEPYFTVNRNDKTNVNIELYGEYNGAGDYIASVYPVSMPEYGFTVYVYLDKDSKFLYCDYLGGIIQFDENGSVIVIPDENDGEAIHNNYFELAVMDSRCDDIVIDQKIYHDFKNQLTLSTVIASLVNIVDYDVTKARVIINGKLVTDLNTTITPEALIWIAPEGAIVINGIFEANGETIQMQAFIAGGATLEVFVGMYGGSGREIYLNSTLVNYELERYTVLNEGDTIQMSIGGGSDKPAPPAEPENPGTSGGNGGSDSRQYMVCVITDLQTKPDDTWVDLVAGEEPTLYEVLLAFGVNIANVQVLYNEMLFAPNSNVKELEGVIIGANDKIFVAPVDAILITINVVNLGSMTTFIAMNTTVEWVIESYGFTGAAGYMLNGNEVTNPAEALITYNSELTVYPPSGDDENKNEDNEGYAPESGFYKGNYTTHVYDSLDNSGTIVYLALNPSYTCTLKKDLANRGVSLDTHDVYLNGVRVTEENGLLNQTLGYYYEDTEKFDHVIIAPKGSVLISLERINTPVMTAAVREGATLYEICEIYALDMLSEITLNGKVIKDLKNTVIKEGDSIVASMTEDVYGSYTGDL